jgi:hypothetical protein
MSEADAGADISITDPLCMQRKVQAQTLIGALDERGIELQCRCGLQLCGQQQRRLVRLRSARQSRRSHCARLRDRASEHDDLRDTERSLSRDTGRQAVGHGWQTGKGEVVDVTGCVPGRAGNGELATVFRLLQSYPVM